MPSLTDQQLIELGNEFRTGAFSRRELARRYGISEATVRRKIKDFDWVQDLKVKFNDEFKNQVLERDSLEIKMSRREKNAIKAQNSPAREDAAVARAAKKKLQVIEDHQGLTVDLKKGLKSMQIEFGKTLRQLKKGKETISALDLKNLAQTMRLMSNAAQNIMTCDRKSFNIEDDVEAEEVNSVHITFYRETRPEPIIINEAQPTI